MISDNQKFNKTIKPNSAFLRQLKDKLPEFFTKDNQFNLNKFKLELQNNNVDELKDGYQLDFIGKDYARRQAGEMPNTVIVPDEKQNQGEGKNSKNLFFTGDNLEVLRHLQNNYQNKIDVIYIDPPYNTGNDGFVYPDSFEYSDDKLKDMFGLDDNQVERLKSIQGKASHSAWLTFMYPRLALSKKLLSNDGVIFTSIDDNEQANLKLLMDEVFGEGNFITKFTWEKTQHFGRQKVNYYSNADYIFAFTRNSNTNGSLNEVLVEFEKTEFDDAPLFNNSNPEKELTFPAGTVRFNMKDGVYETTSDSKYKLLNSVNVKNGMNVNEFKLLFKSRWSNKKVQEQIDLGTTFWVKTSSFAIRAIYAEGKVSLESPRQIIFTNQSNPASTKSRMGQRVDTSENASKYLSKLLGAEYFSYPKPVSLIKYLISLYSQNGDFSKNITILDFFAGSATTADAVMQLNAEDGGNRKFIMVQLPEKTYHINKDGREVPTKGGKAAYDAGFKSIDEISRERIRRAAKKIREDNELTLPEDFDGSFKHYRVVKPVKQTLEEIENFDTNNTNLFTNMVDGFSSNSLGITGNATGEATILTTWLAKDGYSFDADVEEVMFNNYSAHKVEDNRLYLINEGWGAEQTKELLNQLGTHQLEVQSVVIFGYSFNMAELRELESGLKQLDSKVTLIKRY